IKEVEIFGIEVTKIALPRVDFFVRCSKGTYIRSLCAEVGNMLGCGATIENLRRVRSGSFNEKNAMSIEDKNILQVAEGVRTKIIELSDLLTETVDCPVSDVTEMKIRNGCQPTIDVIGCLQNLFGEEGTIVRFSNSKKQLVAIGKMLYSSEKLKLLCSNAQAVKILRVFNS
ncbi:MAG: hypothetical protein WCJ49_06365, partial [Deltaproteobacteria bacterium]